MDTNSTPTGSRRVRQKKKTVKNSKKKDAVLCLLHTN